MSLFDADDYLTPPDEPVAPAPQEPTEVAPAVLALEEALADLPDDAPESQIEAIVEELAIIEVGPAEVPIDVPAEVPIDVPDEQVADESIAIESIADEPILLVAEPIPWTAANPLPAVSISVASLSEPAEIVERGPSVSELWTAVVAQDTAVRALRAAALRPVHAYLLVGPSGVGVRQAATSFAAALLCPRGGCSTCDHCTRALHELHPDLIFVEREGASISVDQAREIIRLATRSPVEGTRKVLVLVDFHLVTNAGPTLLKVIEEPPESTVFVILADHLPPELVTIASRCVQIPFRRLSVVEIAGILIERGIGDTEAQRAAEASNGRLDRAILLASDEHLAGRLSFWEQIPFRLDGSGAAVASLASEAAALLDSAAVGPLEARQAEELAALEARLEAIGGKGGVGQRKEVVERHKRELKRLRDDELRVGFAAIQRAYRGALIDGVLSDAAALQALDALDQSNGFLDRNPNLSLLLQSLFLRLTPLSPR
jgi:DNA polymerase III subunit delta'